MNKRLVNGLTPEQKKEFEDMLKYNEIFDRIREMLKEDLEATVRDRRSLKSIIVQNYSEYQSDRNATERTLIKVLDLITV